MTTGFEESATPLDELEPGERVRVVIEGEFHGDTGPDETMYIKADSGVFHSITTSSAKVYREKKAVKLPVTEGAIISDVDTIYGYFYRAIFFDSVWHPNLGDPFWSSEILSATLDNGEKYVRGD